MPLDWTFTFVKMVNQLPKIHFLTTFRDGIFQIIATPDKTPEVIDQMSQLIMLLSYIAYFPNKDFTKIRLETGNDRFAIHFLDKRNLDDNLLCIFSVFEYDEQNILENWGVEEIMTEFVMDYYLDAVKSQEPFEFSSFQEWIAPEILDFFKDWTDAKNEAVLKKIEMKTLSLSEGDEKKYEQWWDLQLINEYGQPITNMLSFIDKDSFIVTNEEELTTQTLESMSISALKILIDQQGSWDINYLKNRLKNQMGFSYSFFKRFEIHGIKFLLIMNSALYEIENEKCLQMFRGNEFDLLTKIAQLLSDHSDFFTAEGLLVSKHRKIVQQMMLEYIKQTY